MEKENRMEGNAGREPALQQDLLKVIAEQNKEKLLEYDVASDTAVIYYVKNGRFEKENTVGDYVKGRHFGTTFIREESRPAYLRAFRACLKKPSHRIVDIKCALPGKAVEWHRLYLVSMGEEETQTVQKVAGRFVSIQKDRQESERILRRAELDALTGLYNHRAFEEKGRQAITADSAFFMLDVDDFKMINDSLGHAMGDSVLAQTGKILQSMVKGRGIAGRMGGDEFAALVSGFSDRQEVAEFCRKLRKTLKTITFDIEYCASIGVCTADGREMAFEDMYYEADQALYAAKNGGKNQFVLYAQMDELPGKEPGEPSAEEVAFDRADPAVVLALFEECMAHLRREDFYTGASKVQELLLDFFDADCIVCIRWQDGCCLGVEECHKEPAGMTARLLTDAAEKNGDFYLRKLLTGGRLYVDNVKNIKESYPKQYERLTGCRVWSVMGHELQAGLYSEGLLFAANPRKNVENGGILHMLADYLAARCRYQRLLEQQEFDATHDHLTGLWSRNSYVLFSNRGSDEDYDAMGIVTTDVVGLAGYNKEFGYLNGSKRLVEAARMLEDIFEGYRIFRFDEDEMLAFCPNVEKSDFMLMVRCLQEKAEELAFPLAVGYSWSSHVDIHGQLAESEVVMNNDKLRLMRGVQTAERVEQSVIDEVARMTRAGQYLVYLQPKVSVREGRTVGAEALIRLMDPDIGLVSPTVFIPVLERYNIIHMVDLFVLEEVFKYQRNALDEGRPAVPISVNFSKLTILQPDLIERVRELTLKYDLPEGLIVIEVTETVGDMDHVVVDSVANSLRTMGFALSMDDFGSHYSNLATLIQYDFDSAKIDRSMVTEVTTNHKSRVVLNYMTALISELGIKCIVEGIETKEQVEVLKETKCDIIQGFYFGKPVPMDDFFHRFMKESHRG
ncbi:MAG: EAL domain-containing protein [Muribaculaceae bacterium]|nr:EAL domain-containing protein [Roseburia sp.]MCM1431753.1 EAL domain-containing protein [Muribaculaceae bacterium]MCM1493381.1 EAL domain-containing protein [Muribaculaceae bacterium]